MDIHFNIDPAEFQERKRRRIATANTTVPPPPKVAPVSAPGIHEIATFLPGRLEFEHELDNDAEDLTKDLEIGVCLEFGGDQIIADENDNDVRARLRWMEEKRSGVAVGVKTPHGGKGLPSNGMVNGLVNGHHAVNGDVAPPEMPAKCEDSKESGTGEGDAAAVEEITQPPPIETSESIAFKLTLLEMYRQRVERRRESKAIMFDRGLLEYKKVRLVRCWVTLSDPTPDASCRKETPQRGEGYCPSPATVRQVPDRGRLRSIRSGHNLCFHLHATLTNGSNHFHFNSDESILRKRIQELQHYRRMGLTTAADIEKYELDSNKRVRGGVSSECVDNKIIVVTGPS